MAKKKDLKKDINKMLDQVISECYVHLSYSPKLVQENTFDVISDAMVLKKTLLHKVNHSPQKSSKKEIKRYFSQLIKELLQKSIEFIDRLN